MEGSIDKQRKTLFTIHYFRGIAALLVILHHITGIMSLQFNYDYLNGYFNPGWSGVDFFFVLSGFIISYIHLGDFGKKTELKPFLSKRLIRVYPVYWVVTFLYLPIFLMYGNDNVSIMKSLLLIPQTSHPVLEVGWTLCYEMFFYLLFSLTFVLKPKHSMVLVGLWLMGILFNLKNISNNGESSYISFILSHYNLEFLLGCAVAYIVMKYKMKFAKTLLVLGVLFFLISWLFINLGVFEKYSIPRIICFGFSSALIILGSSLIDLKSKQVFSIKPLYYLGNASYSLYLTHIPIYTVINKIFLVINLYNLLGLWSTTTILVILTVIFGCLFHTFIEKPILKKCNGILKGSIRKDKTVKQAI
ncbi:acyltransferase family protein [Bacillus cereus]|uniref:acyltransferase family protein n=1 Tax=Bacillus cereus TaxID=1396 RepID=UPI000279AE66|nr:acyltransferase [Bacillus cereus]EJR71346.1 hypothetical protein IK9_05997 [Bacillus cereus VD166]